MIMEQLAIYDSLSEAGTPEAAASRCVIALRASGESPRDLIEIAALLHMAYCEMNIAELRPDDPGRRTIEAAMAALPPVDARSRKNVPPT